MEGGGKRRAGTREMRRGDEDGAEQWTEGVEMGTDYVGRGQGGDIWKHMR